MASIKSINKNKLTSQLTNIDNQVKIDDSPFVNNPGIAVFCAKIGAGKSTLLINILEKETSPYYNKFHHIFLVSPSANGDDKYKDMVEELKESDKFYPDLNNSALEDIKTRTNTILENWLEHGHRK